MLRLKSCARLAVSVNLALCALAMQAQSGPLEVRSPDSRITLRFAVVPGKGQASSAGRLVYSVDFRGKPVLDNSALSLKLAHQPPLGTAVRITSSTPGSGVDHYTLLAGKTSAVHDAYNDLTVQVMEAASPDRKFAIEARVYNSAVAFRYQVPKQAALAGYRLMQEDTQFHLSGDATAWALRLPNFQSGYEAEYLRQTVSALSSEGGVPSHILTGAPMLLHLPGVAWAAVTEADLEGNSAMYLEAVSGIWSGHSLVTKISPALDGSGPAVEATLPHHSAWRVILLGDTPGALIESNVITDLNPPNRVADTSWIHPGKAAWDWWSGDLDPEGKPAYTTRNMEYYVDFAAKSGFPYMMLDAGWSTFTDITRMLGNVDVPELVRYAAKRNVKVWIWAHSKAVATQMQTAFPLYQKWGVVGVKIDFIQRNDQKGIQFYYTVAKLAAEHHLMLDFHGATTPWGLERTYPNVLNMEAVLGLEYNKWSRRDGPLNRTMYPFTRMLNGPLDYTPGAFENVTRKEFVPRQLDPMAVGTRAQQLALYVVFRAPFEMVSDDPAAYVNQPGFQFLRDVPVVWDATRVLDGFPGEFVTIARRHGRDWYLGSITDWNPRTLRVPLNFLGNGAYTAEIYEDAPDAAEHPKHVSIRKQTVHSGDTLTLSLAKGGGCAIRFVPAT